MRLSKQYFFATINTVILLVICFVIVPSWAGASLLAACIVVSYAAFVFLVRQNYLERESVYKRSAENIRVLAYYDDLTGLPNRRYAREELEKMLAENRHIVAVCIVDIDRFRNFNNTLGHDFGNIILLQAAERLTRCIGPDDIAARMEGDEFVLVYSQLNREDEVEKIAQRIHEAFSTPFTFQDYRLHTTVSIGVAVHSPDDPGIGADELIKFAAIALSQAKKRGDVVYELYTPVMNSNSLERLTMENELRRAIEQQEFVLHYQPQLELQSGKIVGVEALVRWLHPEKGLVSPGIFVSVAEENGLITSIDDWVMKQACHHIKALHDRGYTDLRVSVNLSSRQFLQQDLVDRIAKVLEECDLKAHYLELEITERMTMDVDRSIQILNELQKLGVRISIDDFGTGYSSLNYLKKFPIHKLKIDRSFVHDIMEDPNDASIVSTIISMSHHLNMKVIAEGVETFDQLRYLNENRCNEIQGYLFSPPVTFEELVELLDNQQETTAGLMRAL